MANITGYVTIKSIAMGKTLSIYCNLFMSKAQMHARMQEKKQCIPKTCVRYIKVLWSEFLILF